VSYERFAGHTVDRQQRGGNPTFAGTRLGDKVAPQAAVFDMLLRTRNQGTGFRLRETLRPHLIVELILVAGFDKQPKFARRAAIPIVPSNRGEPANRPAGGGRTSGGSVISGGYRGRKRAPIGFGRKSGLIK
jgi:hypothetical protein